MTNLPCPAPPSRARSRARHPHHRLPKAPPRAGPAPLPKAGLHGSPGRNAGAVVAGPCDGTTNQHAAVLWETGLVLGDVGSACDSGPYAEIRSLSGSGLGVGRAEVRRPLCVHLPATHPRGVSARSLPRGLHLSRGENPGVQSFSAALGARSVWETGDYYISECRAGHTMSSPS